MPPAALAVGHEAEGAMDPLAMTLLAWGFGAPVLLGGTALASIPIVIHLLNKRRFRQMHWAAMRWLLEAVRKNQRRIRLEQWILLTLRTILVLLVAMAMAKPFVDAQAIPFVPSTIATHNVIVFDNSMSMHYALTDRSRWERAKSLAQAILDDCQKGDLVSVVVMGSPATVLVGDPSPYLAAVSEEIDAIKRQDGMAHVEPAMDKVADIFKNSRALRKQVFLITDLQRNSWLGDGTGNLAEMGAKLRSISEQAVFTILDVGGEENPNLSVVGLENGEPLVVRGRPSSLRARVTNFSSRDVSDLRVELLVNGQVEATETINIPAHQEGVAAFRFTFNDAGDRVLEARIGEDALRADNQRWIVAQVRDSLSVLIIDGQPSGESFASEADYLKVALSPGSDRPSVEPGLVRVETRLESDLLEARLDEWDAVILCNVAQFTESEASVLNEYLTRGGGVLYFLGSQVNLQAYNKVLFRQGKGILPVELLELAGSPPPSPTFFSFDPREYRHPVVESFAQHEQSGLLSAKIHRYVKSRVPADSPAQVVLGFEGGDPAIVMSPVGRGMVGVVTTSADLDWNSWAISPSFLPVVNKLVQQLVAGRGILTSVSVGEPFVAPAPRQGYDVDVTIAGPEEGSPDTPVRLEEERGVALLRYPSTDRAGVYRARWGSPIDRVQPFAVNPWPQESNLERIEREEMLASFPGWEFKILNRWQNDSARGGVGSRQQGDLHLPLLYAALALIFVETFLAWKFGQPV